MKSFLAALVLLAFAPSAFAHFHLMQVEQVVGSLGGDTSAQAIQLRMRSLGQNVVNEARVRAWDATGANPVLLLDIPANVSTSAPGSRVLLCTPAFTAAMQEVTPGFAPDFTMTNPIPASYLAAGRVTFEGDDGTIYWSLAWGGAAYTGSNAGTTNDNNNNYGPPFASGLPTLGYRGLLFQGAAGAQSVSNSTDYAFSASPATVRKNNGTSFLVSDEPVPGSVDDGFDPDLNDESYSVVVRPNGKIVVGGLFTTVDGASASGLVQLHSDGSRDPSFSANTNDYVKAVVLQDDGKVLVGGAFTTVAGVTRNCIARLNANGTLDTSFNPNAPGIVECIAVQPDGKILIGGGFTTVGGVTRNRMARLHADGSLDATFNANASDLVLAIRLQADGKILTGGFFGTIGGGAANRFARLHADGTLDTTFDPDSNGTVRTIEIQPDGKIIAAGAFTMMGGVARNRVARVDSTGALDMGYDPDVSSTILGTALQPDGKLLVGSQATQAGGQTRNRIARFHIDGSLDLGFDPNANDTVFSIAVQEDAKIVLAGRFTMLGGVTKNRIARIHADGTLDKTADPDVDGDVYATSIQPDGRVVIAGEFTTVGGVDRDRIARLKPDGSLDVGFIADANDVLRATALQADGKILVGGKFTDVGGNPRNRIARLETSGAVDASFDPDANGDVYAIAVQADGKILVGGGFTSIAGATRNRLARLNANGTLDTSFDPGVINSDVFTIAVQSDGDIVIGGTFTSVDGTTRNRIARIHGDDGTLDASFDPDSEGTVRTIVLRPDGKILVGGAFTAIAGAARSRVALLNTNGTLVNSFDPNAGSTVYAFALQTDGMILIGGAFTSMSGSTRNRVARLDSGGVLDPTFDPNASEAVYTLALQTDGKVLIGGNFTGVTSVTRNHLARVTNGSAGQNVSVDATGSTVVWTRQGTSPEVSHVTVESSIDQVVWTPLGEATRVGGTSPNWELTGLTLPFQQNLFLRARGFETQGGVNGGDNSIHESIRLVYLDPEISVEQPAGAVLADNANEVNYGSVMRNITVVRTFTIKNLGSAPLTGVSASIDGTDSALFNVSTPPDTTVPPGGSTTLEVEFTPTTLGAKSAMLHIDSNDLDEDPFDVDLSGTGIPNPGVISIDYPAGFTITVNEEAGNVQIPIIRSSGTDGVVGFTIQTANGKATVDNDFTAPVTPQSLNDGVSTLSVAIPIINSPATSEANEAFTVTISAPTGGAVIGAVNAVTVRIIDSSDTTAPGVTISAPLAGSIHQVVPGGTVNITGTATDAKGIKQVQVSLNGSPFADATLNTPGADSPTNTTYTRAVTPVAGTNTVAVKSIDHRNNTSATVTRTFMVHRPLVVNVDTVIHGSVTAGFSPSSFREVGKSYTITATPKPPSGAFSGGIFHAWEIDWAPDTPTPPAVPTTDAESAARIGVPLSALEKQTLTFIYREGMQLTAEFDESPFASMAGIYWGLIRPSDTLPDRPPVGAGGNDGTTRTNATEGLFKATLQNTGAFSGTLTIDGLTLNVAGAFDHHGDARFGTTRVKTLTVARPNKPSLVVALHINIEDNETDVENVHDKITGTVTSLAFQQSVIQGVSVIDSDRAFYNGTSKIVPAAYLGAANANGTFTTIFPAKDVGDQPAGITEQDYAQGTGVATIIVTKAGAVTVTGTLADGSVLTASTALSQANRFPLFVQLYGKLGFLSGFVQLDNSQPESDMAAENLKWLRPFNANSHYYPAGWTNPINVDLLAARYAAVAGQSVLRAANGANLPPADADGNVGLSFADGLLSETLSKAANLSTADVVTKVPVNDPTFTMMVNRATGAVTGTFMHTDDTGPTFSAIVYQKGPNAGAYGFFLTKQPVPIDYTGESGRVIVTAAP